MTPAPASPPAARVTTHHDGGVCVVRLDDGRGNALGALTLQQLASAFDAARGADAMLLLGRPRIFSGGLDLFEIAPHTRAEIIDFMDLLHAVRRQLFAHPRPVVAALAGSAFGAGASIACCADWRLGVRDRGQFALPEVRLGLPIPVSAMEIVRSALAPSDAARVMLFGTSFDPAQALHMGLLHHLTDAALLEDQALEAARSAARMASAAVTIKAALRHDALQRMDAARSASHEAFADAWDSTEARDRVRQALAEMSRPKPA